jgi:hypothetical protein
MKIYEKIHILKISLYSTVHIIASGLSIKSSDEDMEKSRRCYTLKYFLISLRVRLKNIIEYVLMPRYAEYRWIIMA